MFKTFEHGIAPHQELTDATAPWQLMFHVCRDMDNERQQSWTTRVLTSRRFPPLQATSGNIVMCAIRILAASQQYK
jgi:hypothetical protein